MLFANSGDKCFKFYAVGKCVFREEVIELYNTHGEADTRMYFHLFPVMSFSNVVIRNDDTDCLIISLGIQSKLDESINVWLEVGKQSKNSLRYRCERTGAQIGYESNQFQLSTHSLEATKQHLFQGKEKSGPSKSSRIQLPSKNYFQICRLM